MYKLTFKVPIYEFGCEVIFTDDILVEINKLHKKKKIEPLDSPVYGYAIHGVFNDKYHLFYRLKDVNINTLSHEISHLIDFVFEDRGIEPATGEPRAYLTGYITEKIYDFVCRKQIQLKRPPKEKQVRKNQKNQSQEVPVSNPSQSSPASNS
jgi:hypothetical protein